MRAWSVLVALFVAVGVLVRPTGLGDTIDTRTLSAIRPLDTPATHAGWEALTRIGSPSSYLFFCLALMLVAAVRHRRRWVLVAPLTMLGSALTAQALKQVLAIPRPDVPFLIGDAAWPSGHSTAAMTVALLAVLIAPRRMRPTVATLGAFGAVCVGFGMVAVGGHYPTDIFGGYLWAAVWVSGAAIVLLEWQRRSPVVRPADPRPVGVRHLAGPVLLLVLGTLTALSLAARDTDGVFGTIRDHTVAVGVMGGLIALALTLAALTASLPETRDDEADPAEGAAPGAVGDPDPEPRPTVPAGG